MHLLKKTSVGLPQGINADPSLAIPAQLLSSAASTRMAKALLGSSKSFEHVLQGNNQLGAQVAVNPSSEIHALHLFSQALIPHSRNRICMHEDNILATTLLFLIRVFS